jgi:hypothetical protein
MRNVWKGLVIGAFAGAAIGIALDIARALGRRAIEVGSQTREAVREHAPEVAEALASRAADVAERVKQADIPGHLSEMAQHVAGSPPARAVVEGAHAAGEAVRDVTKRVADAVSDTMTEVRHGD